MERPKWVERQFTFDFPEGWMANILERLRGTPIRIESMVLSLSEEEGSYRPNGKWSIKEHIGHLSDLEVLQEGRVQDFLEKRTTLRAADMSNKATYEANYHLHSISELVSRLSNQRNHLVKLFEELDDDVLRFRSLHPRLQVMMRPVDLAFFTAEHDDHHLASIREIMNGIRQNSG